MRDVATGVPSDYVPVDYTSKALQQTNAQLSWDQDDPERRKKLRRKLTGERALTGVADGSRRLRLRGWMRRGQTIERVDAILWPR